MVKKIFKRQAYHVLVYIILGIVFIYYSAHYTDHDKSLWGLTVHEWVIVSWIAAGLHQFWIVLFWRLELYYGVIKKIFGRGGFFIYKAGFVLFASVRLVAVIPASKLSARTLEINELLRWSLIGITTPFILWSILSVVLYFGINRAFGADHFFPEYRSMSLEKRGTFRYIPNSMYTILLLVIYHPALFYASLPGLVFALIHHLFIWTHYFCTEKPDLEEIYGKVQ